jgi:hypothetical protein
MKALAAAMMVGRQLPERGREEVAAPAPEKE